MSSNTNTPQTTPETPEENVFEKYKESPALFLNERQASQRYAISLSKLRNDRSDIKRRGRGLPYIKFGRMIRYFQPECDQIFFSCRVNPQN